MEVPQKTEMPKSPNCAEKIVKRAITLYIQLISVHKQIVLKLVQTNLVCHDKHLILTKLGQSVWENLDLGHVYRPHYIWYVLTTLASSTFCLDNKN